MAQYLRLYKGIGHEWMRSAMRYCYKISQIVLLLWVFITSPISYAAEPLRVGVLKFGTVSWILDVIKAHGLDKKAGFELQIVALGSKSATNVAIQGGSVDIIVTDWLWVTRQRASGRDYTFAPYSSALGSVMVPANSDIHSLKDLSGKRLGVAGGPVDKSWLLLRAYTQKTLKQDIAKMVEPNFAAPPLLNQLILRNEIPAVLNFWPYAARLEAKGFKVIVNVSDLLSKFGIKQEVPFVGWTFSEAWAKKHKSLINGFLKACEEAATIMKQSDKEWQRLSPLVKAPDKQTLIKLRNAYRKGIINCFGKAELDAANKMYSVLVKEGGAKLFGGSKSLSPGTFWEGYPYKQCIK